MTATNHAITGAVIGLALGNPYLAIPLSLVSHYAMDTLPHFGKMWPLKSKKFVNYLLIEALFCFLIVLTMFIVRPQHCILGMICAFIAAAPDLLSIKFFKKTIEGKKYVPGRYFKFASGIQKKESPENIKYDILWFIALLILFIKLLDKA